VRGKLKVCLEKYGSGQPQRLAPKKGGKCKNRSVRVPNSPFDYVMGLQIFEASTYWLESFIVDEKYTTIFSPTKAVFFQSDGRPFADRSVSSDPSIVLKYARLPIVGISDFFCVSVTENDCASLILLAGDISCFGGFSCSFSPETLPSPPFPRPFSS